MHMNNKITARFPQVSSAFATMRIALACRYAPRRKREGHGQALQSQACPCGPRRAAPGMAHRWGWPEAALAHEKGGHRASGAPW